jgi:hypothetical protein
MKGTFERLPRLDEKGVAWGGERTLIARAGTVDILGPGMHVVGWRR